MSGIHSAGFDQIMRNSKLIRKPFGFNNNKNSNKCIKNVSIEFIDIVIKSYSYVPNDNILRKETISFVHKMVYLLKDNTIN